MRFILIQVAIVGSLKITPLSNHTIEDFTSTLRSSLQTAYKTFPLKIQHSLLATEWQELQLSCNDENVTWYHSNFFINKHKSFLQVPIEKVQNGTLFIRKLRQKDAGVYYCSDGKTSSARIIVGYRPNGALSISFILTSILAFLITFLINWFDLGNYYCSFLENRLKKVQDIATEDVTILKDSVRASRASKHYDSYDQKSQDTFIKGFLKGTQNLNQNIKSSIENIEFTIPIRDVLKEQMVKIGQNWELNIPIEKFNLSWLKSYNATIREETEAELALEEQGEDIDSDTTKRNTPIGRKNSTHSVANIHFPKSIKRIKKYVQNVNIKMQMPELAPPEFLENMSLKFKFSPGSGATQVNRTGYRREPAYFSKSSPISRPNTLDFSTARVRHNSNSSGSGVFTVDLVDGTDSVRSMPISSSVVVTPIDCIQKIFKSFF